MPSNFGLVEFIRLSDDAVWCEGAVWDALVLPTSGFWPVVGQLVLMAAISDFMPANIATGYQHITAAAPICTVLIKV